MTEDRLQSLVDEVLAESSTTPARKNELRKRLAESEDFAQIAQLAVGGLRDEVLKMHLREVVGR